MATSTAVHAGPTTWTMDPAHSSVEFAIKHMMLTTVRGRFKTIEATLHADPERPELGHVEVRIDVASIDTGVPDRDAHLRSADFFDVETHPQMTFRSRKVDGKVEEPGDRFQVTGDLTIRGTTLPVTLICIFAGRGKDPAGKQRVGFAARGDLDRRDWGLEWNQVIETGGVLVANTLRIEAEVQFVAED